MTINKPVNFDPNHYFNHYINSAPDLNLVDSIAQSTKELAQYIDELPAGHGEYAYAKGKWTIKQVLQHINDTERILAYRAFRISRKDQTELAGFDENKYAENDYSNSLSLTEIKAEFMAIRNSTHLLFSKMNNKVIDFEGIAGGVPITPRALGFVISGHAKHHLTVLMERYSNNPQ